MAHDHEEVGPKASSAASNTAEVILRRSDSNTETSNVKSRDYVSRKGRNQRGSGKGRDNGKGRERRGDHGGRQKRDVDQGGRQKRDMGRKEWSRNRVDKRSRNEEERAAKRQKIEVRGVDAKPARFTEEEIAAEERRPKRKVAVLIGYAGSGYKGMQINKDEKTIEGDLFSAFVSAGAISKANADDPKKSSLVRCARTDKGVHAAGNVISLKLIVEDSDIVKKINDGLPPQIRVWGFVRTTSSFSCYQTCDSRWYEYLIPTYSFLPPHPESFLSKKIVESAKNETAYERFKALYEDVTTFWEEAEKTYVNPILQKLDPVVRRAVMETIHASEEDPETPDQTRQLVANGSGGPDVDIELKLPDPIDGQVTKEPIGLLVQEGDEASEGSWPMVEATVDPAPRSGDDGNKTELSGSELVAQELPEPSSDILAATEAAIREVKLAYIKAKKAYRISNIRRQRIQEAMSAFLGTQNFHNYTILKAFKDPSANRVIRSFKVGSDPIIINDTQWLSLKIHGQSFMMHQIRKMVSMVAMVVRCGCPIDRIKESYGPHNISIPKAPGLGLLLEKPVFESYNERAVRDFQKEKIDFETFNKEIEEFKEKEIYERIFREEEKDHHFHSFFHHIDHYPTNAFLWVTSTGIAAATQPNPRGGRASRGSAIGDSEDESNSDDGDS